MGGRSNHGNHHFTLIYLVYILSISAGLFVLLCWSVFSKPFQWAGIYLLSVGILQVVAKWSLLNYGSNLAIYTWSFPFVYGLIFCIFYQLAVTSFSKKVFIAVGLIGLLIITYLMMNVLLGISKIWLVLPPFNLSVVALCLLYYSFLLASPKETPLSRQPDFWLVSSFFFYHLVSSAYLMASVLLKSNMFLRSVELDTISVVIFYIFCWMSILVAYRSKHAVESE